MLTAQWRTSSYSGDGGACVEVRRAPSGDIEVRDSKDRTGGTLTFSPSAWTDLLEAIRTNRLTP